MKKYKVLTKSRGLTIPRDMAAHLDIDAGTAVDLTASGDGKLIITRLLLSPVRYKAVSGGNGE